MKLFLKHTLGSKSVSAFCSEGECTLLDRTCLHGEQQIASESPSCMDLCLRNFGLRDNSGMSRCFPSLEVTDWLLLKIACTSKRQKRIFLLVQHICKTLVLKARCCERQYIMEPHQKGTAATETEIMPIKVEDKMYSLITGFYLCNAHQEVQKMYITLYVQKINIS